MLGHRAPPGSAGAVRGGSVGLDAYRTIRSIGSHTLARVWKAAAGVRGQVWRRTSATTGAAPVVLDLDASLVQIHSEHKQVTAATYKGGFGFTPMFCFADASGEVLAAILRPGNATANSIVDQLAAVDAALAQLPAEISVGHRPGDEAAMVRRAVRVRADSAGCSPKLPTAFRGRNVGFAVVARTNARVQGAIFRAIDAPRRWTPALTQGGEVRPGAEVAELTDPSDSRTEAARNAPDRASRAAPSLRPDQACSPIWPPLLGSLHRRRGRPGRARRAHVTAPGAVHMAVEGLASSVLPTAPRARRYGRLVSLADWAAARREAPAQTS